MAFSKPIRGGSRNTKTFADKRDEAMSHNNISSTLGEDCGCTESCMWSLLNDNENPVELIEELRKPRFKGV